MKLDLLTNATVVHDAIKFASQKSKKDELKPYPRDIGNDVKPESSGLGYIITEDESPRYIKTNKPSFLKSGCLVIDRQQ
jgi:hypothetical protein